MTCIHILYVYISGEFERDCDSRSTMSSQISDYSPSTENVRTGFPNNNRQDFALSPREEIENVSKKTLYQECSKNICFMSIVQSLKDLMFEK